MRFHPALPWMIRALVITGLLLWPPSVPATAQSDSPAIVHVAVDGADTGLCGDSWESPCSLQHALTDVAQEGSEIWVERGIYTPTSDGDRNQTFVLGDGIKLYGGFKGDEAEFTQRRLSSNPADTTVLSGEIGSPVVKTDNSYHVVTFAEGAEAELDGFTISDGYADDDGTRFDAPRCGGGVQIYKPTHVTLRNLTVADNYAAVSGGGVCAWGEPAGEHTLYVDHISLTSNTSVKSGGGMHVYATQLIMDDFVFVSFNEVTGANAYGGGLYLLDSPDAYLENASIEYNKAPSGSGGGLAIRSTGEFPGTAELINVTMRQNQARSGGGMYAEATPLILNRLAFLQNTASGKDYYGGGLFLEETPASTLTDIMFIGNQAQDGSGGGLAIEVTHSHADQTIDLNNLTFDRNSAADGGGAALFISQPIHLTNATFSGNSAAQHGGGILLEKRQAGDPEVRLTHASFAGNTAGAGGGFYVGANSEIHLVNSILWENTPDQAASPGEALGDFATNLIAGGCPENFTCTDTLTGDPKFGPLAGNGGYGSTLALTAGSAAINAADPTGCPEKDQRGQPRRKAFGFCDLGAFEAQLDHMAGEPGPHTALTGSLFDPDITVTVQDQYNNPLGGVSVKYEAPESGPGAALAVDHLTGADGVARPQARANLLPGTYTVFARVEGIDPFEFSMENLLYECFLPMLLR